MTKHMTDNMDNGTDYLRMKAVSRLFGVSTTTIYEWQQKPGFPAPRRLGQGYTAWSRAELIRWMDGHKVDTLGPPRGRAAKVKGK
jgi:predicted DNA-binding transcriptional regulator AlpA